MASLLPQIYLDVGAGITPSDGAKLQFNIVGSSTPKNIFTDAGAGTPLSNPVIADSLGVFPQIFISGSYDWVLSDKNSVQQDTGTVSEVALVSGSTTVKNFATLALAVADTGLIDGNAINLSGRKTTNDGGGGMADVVLSSTVTEDAFRVIQATGVGTLSIVIRDDENVNLKRLGAGFGVGADDVGALTAAITYASVNDLPVYAPEGSYDLSTWSVQTVSSPLKLHGESSDVVTFTGSALTDFLNVDTTNFTMFGIKFDTWQFPIVPKDAGAAMDYFIFDNEVVNVEQFVTTPESTCNFRLFILERNIADTIGSIFCNLACSAGTILNARIKDNTLTNIGTITSTSGIGIRLGHDNMVLGGSYIVTGNSIDGVRASANNGARGIIVHNGKKVTIANNPISDVRNVNGTGDATAIYVKAEDDSNTAITGNVLRDGSLGSQGSIEVKGGAGDVSIGNNTISFPSNETGTKAGIALSPKARITAISGGSIRDADIGIIVNCGATITGVQMIDIKGERGIQIFATTGIPQTVTINGCTVDGLGSAVTGSNVFGLFSVDNTTGADQASINVIANGCHVRNVNQAITNKFGCSVNATNAVGDITINGGSMAGVDKIMKFTGAVTAINSLVIEGVNCPDVTGIGWIAGLIPDNSLIRHNVGCEDEPYAASSTELNDIASKWNTVNKREGTWYFNTTVNKPVYSVGTSAASVWNDSAASTVNTPI